MFLKCVKVCVSWNKRNNRNNIHGATIKIRLTLLLLFLMTVKMTIKMETVMTVACVEHITG